MLEIRELYVNIDNKELLKGVNLKINENEIHVLMGPNACGKSTLALTIVGYPKYSITHGEVIFEGKNLNNKNITARAKLGIAIAYQQPPEIRGVKLNDVIKLIAPDITYDPLERVGLSKEFLTRDINLGFSGGERKRSELAQVFAQKPKLAILDEPDSGVDIDSLKLIGKEINEFKKELRCAILVITHHRHILNYLEPTICHIMYEGRIVDSGEPSCLIPCIEKEGYTNFIKKLEVCEKIKR